MRAGRPGVERHCIVARRETHTIPGIGVVHLAFTDASDGDLRVDGDPEVLAGRRRAVVDVPWTWLRQVHGAEVVVVERPGAACGVEADAAVTTVAGAALAVHTADCAGVLLWAARSGPDGPGAVVAAAHAGWRGLVDGVLQRTVATMRSLGASRISYRLGPCISPRAYEFGEDDLARLCDRYGPSVRARTASGRPALDLRAGVRAALTEASVDVADEDPCGSRSVPCTAVDDGFFSWRARADRARQAAVVHWEPTSPVAAP